MRALRPILCILMFAAAASAQGQVRWFRASFDKAWTEAADRNVPILLVVIQEGEEANDQLVDSIIKTPEFAQLAEKTVAIICSREDHGSKRQVLDGTAYSVCERFGAVPCSTHQAHEASMFEELFGGGGTVKTPLVRTYLPNKTQVGELIDIHDLGSYRNIVRKASRKLGPGLDRKTYAIAKRKVADAKRAVIQKRWADAFAITTELKKIGGKSNITKEALKIEMTVLAQGKVLIDKAGKFLTAKKFWELFDTLDTIKKTFSGTAIMDRVKTIEKAVKKDKEGRRIAALHRKQLRLMPQWDKARAFEKKANWILAERAYRSIIKRAKKLPLAARAQAKIDEFMKNPAIKELLESEIKERDAKALLRTADRMKRKGDADGAKKLYQRIVKEFPDTSAAARAKRKLS